MKKVVVGIISKKRENSEFEFFLVKSRRDFGEFTGCWYPPGGHLESGEDESTALIREVKEETSLDIRPVQKLSETAGDVTDQITYWWSAEIIGGELKIDTEEISGFGFFTLSEIKAMSLWPATRKFFEEFYKM
ncbi:MAG: NUDIX hydrolase [Candidatus Uhrbacteria bacterium]